MTLLGIRGRGYGTVPPDTPVLTVTDNADGTITAEIAGSLADALNTLELQPVDGTLGGGAFVAVGSRMGDGTLVVEVAPGFYWARIVSTLGDLPAQSGSVYVRVTSGAGTVLDHLLTAVRAQIIGLALEGIDGANVRVVKVPTDLDFDGPEDLPAIQIASWPSADGGELGGTNARDDVEYPVLVAFLAAGNLDQEVGLSRSLAWRESVARAFRHQRLAGVPSVYDAQVELKPLADAKAWFERHLLVSTLLLRFRSREPRGAGS